MTILSVVLIMAVICGSVAAEEPAQTFFIYPDTQLREPAADEATIPICAISDTTQVAAYAGAVWGEYDLSGRGYCLAWAVGSADEFDDFLADNGYQRMPAGAEP